MPNWFQIPARFTAGSDEDDGISVAINLDSIAFIIQDTARDGKPILKINMMNAQPLDLHGVTLEVFLALSRAALTADPPGESAGNKGE